MKIRLNGQDFSVKDGANLRELLTELKVNADMVAVEVNLRVVPKATHAAIFLEEGDKVEVIHFVGGG